MGASRRLDTFAKMHRMQSARGPFSLRATVPLFLAFQVFRSLGSRTYEPPSFAMCVMARVADAINAQSDAPIEYVGEKTAKACVELHKKIVMADICKNSSSTGTLPLHAADSSGCALSKAGFALPYVCTAFKNAISYPIVGCVWSDQYNWNAAFRFLRSVFSW